ncbi:MAG TPA: putative collagen-binding domain-containing protein, partial [Sedimentisphaerales bacterium]|nr:putative collagen-binding domain-containing protein [Sedimentisphaerales bacterium]
PGHGQSADLVRKCHWSIAMAGGYATYGDWSNGVSYFYMGHAGPGKAAPQLKLLRSFFEKLPYWELRPHDELANSGFCLAKTPEHFIFYFPIGGPITINLQSANDKKLGSNWFDPRTGGYVAGPALSASENTITCPSSEDWALYVQAANAK